MLEFTLKLRSIDDYHLIRKLLKAFDGATIKPVQHVPSIDKALKEVKDGEVEGPFKSVEDLMADLLA